MLRSETPSSARLAPSGAWISRRQEMIFQPRYRQTAFGRVLLITSRLVRVAFVTDPTWGGRPYLGSNLRIRLILFGFLWGIFHPYMWIRISSSISALRRTEGRLGCCARLLRASLEPSREPIHKEDRALHLLSFRDGRLPCSEEKSSPEPPIDYIPNEEKEWSRSSLR